MSSRNSNDANFNQLLNFLLLQGPHIKPRFEASGPSSFSRGKHSAFSRLGIAALRTFPKLFLEKWLLVFRQSVSQKVFPNQLEPRDWPVFGDLVVAVCETKR